MSASLSQRSGVAANVNAPPTLKDYLAEVATACNERDVLASMVLFGSSATGGYQTPTSDVDLLLVLADRATGADRQRILASRLDAWSNDRNADEVQRILGAADARFSLLEDVLALLSRLARDGARADDELSRLLQLVREEAAHRIDAEEVVAALLHGQPA